MNRLTKAWKALRGTLEPEVREVEKPYEVKTTILGSPEPVMVYAVTVSDEDGSQEFVVDYERGVVRFPATKTLYYVTCEQAHAEHPGCQVEAKQIWRIGRIYLTNLNVFPVEVQPKPKRPKGAVRG